MAQLKNLYPPRKVDFEPVKTSNPTINVSLNEVRNIVIHKTPRATAPSFDGWTRELFLPWLFENCAGAVHTAIAMLTNGTATKALTLPDALTHHQTHSNTTWRTQTPPGALRHHQTHSDTTWRTQTPPDALRHHQTHSHTTRRTQTPPKTPPDTLRRHQTDLDALGHRQTYSDTTRRSRTPPDALRRHQTHSDITRRT